MVRIQEVWAIEGKKTQIHLYIHWGLPGLCPSTEAHSLCHGFCCWLTFRELEAQSVTHTNGGFDSGDPWTNQTKDSLCWSHWHWGSGDGQNYIHSYVIRGILGFFILLFKPKPADSWLIRAIAGLYFAWFCLVTGACMTVMTVTITFYNSSEGRKEEERWREAREEN